jgi:hypothetical protein
MARQIVNALNAPLPHDISERLRAARTRAVAARRISSVQIQTNGTLTMGQAKEALRPLTWLASMLPLLALVVGLVTIKYLQDEHRAAEVAEVDTALLTDELPPAAYTDPGFLRYLRMPSTAIDSSSSGAKSE